MPCRSHGLDWPANFSHYVSCFLYSHSFPLSPDSLTDWATVHILDLKLDNIMVAFEDQSTIEAFVRGQAARPMARKHVGDRTVYRCHNDFGPISKGLAKMIPQITDFGLAQRGDKAAPNIHPIQPDEFRAPEVLLGIGWSYSADVWNFGAMVICSSPSSSTSLPCLRVYLNTAVLLLILFRYGSS